MTVVGALIVEDSTNLGIEVVALIDWPAKIKMILNKNFGNHLLTLNIYRLYF